MVKFLQFIFLITVSFTTFSQQIEIKGRVTDDNGTTLPGVNVVLKGTTIGTITDAEGNYLIKIYKPSDILQFSYVGYVTQEITVGDKTVINVTMLQDLTKLEEVVVVGYGTMKKSDLTGAVSNVKTKEIPIIASPSIDNLLQGKVAGMTVRMNSAQPGGGVSLSIRGGGNPLIVIDGVPITNNNKIETGILDADLGYSGGIDRDPLNTINPSDIESIDILKDASSAAIYGSAASDGVIFITTKKGKEGKINVEYRGSFTLQTPKPYLDLLDAKEFMEQHNRFEQDYNILTRKAPPYGTATPPTTPLFFSEATIDTTTINTDWLDILMRNGSINEHNISFNGGTEFSKIFASFNYYGNKALLENSDYYRYSGRVNVDLKLTKWLKAGSNITFSQVNSNNASSGANSGGPEKFNMLQAAYVYSPTVPIYDSLGRYEKTFDPKITNPASFLEIDDLIKNTRFFTGPFVEINFLKNLKLNVVGGIDKQTSNRSFYLPRSVRNVQLPNGMAQLHTNSIDNYSVESYISYNLDFQSSNLTLVAGTGYYKSINKGFNLMAYDFFTDAFSFNNVSASSDDLKDEMNSYHNESTKLSQFFRVNYSLLNKYIITIVGRLDGSSKFAKNKKWGFFPGISGAWRINNEEFIKDVSFISDLKLRLGYGTVGNEGSIGNNPWTLYSTGYPFLIGTTFYPGVAITQIENPNLSWETDIITNIGLDFGLIQNRISGILEYFIKTKRDLLSYNQLRLNMEVGRQVINIGTQRSKGFDFTLITKNLVGNFSWNTEITISNYNLNWVERNPQVTLKPWEKETDPVYAVYGFGTDGIIKSFDDTVGYVSGMAEKPQLGNIKYVDKNGDGILNENDVVMLHDGIPDFTGGLNNTFKFKGFDLGIYTYGMLGRKANNGYINFLNPTAISDKIYPSNTITEIKNVWSSDNQNGIYPGLSQTSNPYNGANPTGVNDFWLMDASFIRIKNLTFGYTLPDNLAKKMKINLLRVFVDFQNLYTITSFKGIDPEITEQNPYPQALSSTIGINVSF
jgi:TonB-linked SusC/RagA family outer membrane protein